MSKFIALPVGQGDAFYLERSDFRALVDGGRSKRAISGWMRDICKTAFLDVVICTHKDADHAYGILGLLEEWCGTIKEVWLPGSWTLRMRDLLTKPQEFLLEINKNIMELKKKENFDPNISLEDISNIDAMKELNNNEEGQYFDLDEVIEDSAYWPVKHLPMYMGDVGFYPYLIYEHNYPVLLLLEAIEAAKNIRQIAILAYNRGCKIRFFDFGKPVGGGGGEPGKLEPVNSEEIVSPSSQNNISALSFLALTVSNKQSLVFYSPESEEEPSILFSADSDLAFSMPNNKPSRVPIITSPHHGSEDNANAYSSVSSWLNNLEAIWVRSDCKSKKRPGETYNQQKKRICTLCNSGENTKQTVKLHSVCGNWKLTPGTRHCSWK